MARKRLIKTFKKIHKWPAIIISFIAILFAVSGIVMNHRQFFSGVDVSRNLLPKNYHYKNWNLAAVRGSVQLEDALLMYGNIGVWKTDDDLKSFEDFNRGFPKGIDNRKIYSIVLFNDVLFAGTHLGLYKRGKTENSWQKLEIPVEKERIADLEIKDDKLLVLTRNYLLESTNGQNFRKIQLPEPVNYQRKTGLFNTFWELHSGELFGLAGKLFVDLLGLVTILLSVTGLLHFFFPKWIKRKKKKIQSRTEKLNHPLPPLGGNRNNEVAGKGNTSTDKLVRTKKLNLNWHNVGGYVFAVFLLINTFSGMHLRPPLLIAIANKQVGIIPGTHLDSPNPWFDKLRRIHWDAANRRYIFSTSDGFFFADENLSEKLIPAPSQPPVSVMGCNVLEPIGENYLMVGSFSGMFVWNPQTGMVADFFTGQPYHTPQGMARPIGANTVAGFVQSGNKSWWFDYSAGAIELNAQNEQSAFTAMPEEIRKASPMSLWNVSLEVHTGRIFEHLVGSFYILFVPLAGICFMLVIISGFFLWWMVFRKKNKTRSIK
ncbi:PepSY-associated TM helix domain-containing protein [uncultured Draconibacterium sp.]|uniref:PepSY-associated TM helix domain-containing protein n=1 Tax=uncultured Draconibacterium sp. TaxID=1573823 RepID=UPI0029C635A5|nr:PepSY-associated TM helix domain-containing protein [uncultured Draconibacterium sp.]